ncbi:unnamed protein product [Lepeophtheirus salmonis]|uniref:(salmon louse) hypothetical protein n=1 Tax=Lepeophtheirus salmonis TaxID=72036 RepID=A0A7R8CWK0_LEPSM|nr:unnamed protein product [Lepeophtheirus salmonis]CAF2952930.1 unnamed protein product [Lepeophtheirus salmonis]
MRPSFPHPQRDPSIYSIMSQQEAASGARISAELTNLTGANLKVVVGTEVPPPSGQQQAPSPKLTKRERACDRREANWIRNVVTRAVETTAEMNEKLEKIRGDIASTRAR